jgi:uncharacterized membrane protein
VTDVPPPPPPVPPSSGGQPPVGPTGPDAGAALSYGWEKFKDNAGVLIGVILIPVVLQLVLQLIGFGVIRGWFGYVVFGILSAIVSLGGSIGIYNAALMITAGETPDIGKAFTTDRWGEWLVFALVYGLFVGIGALFCGIGALVVLAFLGLAPYYFLDQRMSLGDALNASLDSTRRISGLPLAIALTALVGFLGIVVCYIGALVTMPIAYVGVGLLYRRATNQPVAP